MAYLVELMMNGVGPKPCIGGYESVKFSVRIFLMGVQRGAVQSYATLEYVELMYDTIDPKLFEGETITSVQLT